MAPKRVPGYWKLDTSLLLYEMEKEEIRNVISEVIENNKNMDICISWEFVKYRVKQKCILIPLGVNKIKIIEYNTWSKTPRSYAIYALDIDPNNNFLNDLLLRYQTELCQMQRDFSSRNYDSNSCHMDC